MEKSLAILVLAICVSFTVAADEKLLNWIVDYDTSPEMLAKNMLGKSNAEIQKAVFDAYTIQMDIISEYSGHSYDPLPPFGYIKNEISIPLTETFQSDSELTLTDNVFKGLASYNENSIVLKYAPDQIVTEFKWKDAEISGSYSFSNATFYEQGNYLIELKNLKYLAPTTFSGNTMLYPNSVPKSSISYEHVKASFSKTLPEVNCIKESPNLKFFLENVAFQHTADDIASSVHNNITISIRQAMKEKPHVIFKNVSDPHFKGFNGNFPGGEQYWVDEIFTNGLDHTYLRVIDVFVDMATKNVSAKTEFVLHQLSGDFKVFVLDESKSSNQSTSALFTIGRIDMTSVSNMLNGTDCFTITNIVDTVVNISPESSLNKPEFNEIIAKKYAETLTKKFDNALCPALAVQYNPEAGNF